MWKASHTLMTVKTRLHSIRLRRKAILQQEGRSPPKKWDFCLAFPVLRPSDTWQNIRHRTSIHQA
jgi:hypothetical protein